MKNVMIKAAFVQALAFPTGLYSAATSLLFPLEMTHFRPIMASIAPKTEDVGIAPKAGEFELEFLLRYLKLPEIELFLKDIRSEPAQDYFWNDETLAGSLLAQLCNMQRDSKEKRETVRIAMKAHAKKVQEGKESASNDLIASRIAHSITSDLYRKLYYQAQLELSDKHGWNQQDLPQPLPEDELLDEELE